MRSAFRRWIRLRRVALGATLFFVTIPGSLLLVGLGATSKAAPAKLPATVGQCAAYGLAHGYTKNTWPHNAVYRRCVNLEIAYALKVHNMSDMIRALSRAMQGR
jgi:hypothetical protein